MSSVDEMNCRVLHSVPNWLPVSENWIYPQVVRVPAVIPAVFCDRLIDNVLFPMPVGNMFVDQPEWVRSLGGKTIMRRAARRGAHQISSSLALDRVRRWRPHLIHAHFGNRGCEMLSLSQKLGVPLVTSFYGYDAWQLPQADPQFRARLVELFHKGHLFLVEGPALGRRLEQLGCPANRIAIQRLGVDLLKFEFAARTFTTPAKFIMVGRFVEKKGFVDGLKACAIAASAGADFSVTIVGDAAPDDSAGMLIKQELTALATMPPLQGRVNFLGFVKPDVLAALIRCHDVMLAPSRHARNGDAEGGLPVALIEAMAQGLVCVASDHCDIPELVIDGMTGFGFPEGEVHAMANRLMQLNAGKAQLSDLAKRGHAHVRDRFDREKQLARLSTIYQGLARQGAGLSRA